MNRISRLYVFTALVCLGGCASSGGSSGAPEPPRDEAPQMVSRGVPPALRVPVTASGRASVRVTIEVLIDETGLPDMSTFKVTGIGAEDNRDALAHWIEQASFRPARHGYDAVPGIYHTSLAPRVEVRRVSPD